MRWIATICALIGLFAVQDLSPQVRGEGELWILDGSGVDLDDARLGGHIVFDGINEPESTKLTFKGSDFWFRNGKRRYFVPQRGAMFSKTIFTAASYAECAAAVYEKGEIRVDELPKGSQICLHTNEGRYSSIQIKNYDSKNSVLSINHVTWEK